MNLQWIGAILIIAGCGGIGFGMALAMNANALNAYSAMTEMQKQEILDKAHHARSEREMHEIVNSIIN